MRGSTVTPILSLASAVDDSVKRSPYFPAVNRGARTNFRLLLDAADRRLRCRRATHDQPHRHPQSDGQ